MMYKFLVAGEGETAPCPPTTMYVELHSAF